MLTPVHATGGRNRRPIAAFVVTVAACTIGTVGSAHALEYRGELVVEPLLALGLPVGDFARGLADGGGDAIPGLGFGARLEYYPFEQVGIGLQYSHQRIRIGETSSPIRGSHYSHTTIGGYVRVILPSDKESVKFSLRAGATYGDLAVAGRASGGYDQMLALDVGLGMVFQVTDQAAVSLEAFAIHVPILGEHRVIDGVRDIEETTYNGQWLGLRIGFPLFPFVSGG